MPRGGHNRKPREQKALSGTLRKGREAAFAPQVDPCKVPEPPRSLKPAERVLWRELAAEVEALGVYSSSDRTTFRLLVKTVAMAEDVSDAYMPPTARVRLVQAANSLLSAFGLSPASRGKVNAASKKKQDTAAELLGFSPKVIAGGKDG